MYSERIVSSDVTQYFSCIVGKVGIMLFKRQKNVWNENVISGSVVSIDHLFLNCNNESNSVIGVQCQSSLLLFKNLVSILLPTMQLSH